MRIEIAKALERGIRVIPVLVGGATLPSPSDLPDNLRALCDRQAMEVRDTRFHDDAKELIAVLHGTLHGTGFLPKQVSLKRLIPALLLGVVVLAAGAWLLLAQRQKASSSNPPAASTGQGAQAPGLPLLPRSRGTGQVTRLKLQRMSPGSGRRP